MVSIRTNFSSPACGKHLPLYAFTGISWAPDPCPNASWNSFLDHCWTLQNPHNISFSSIPVVQAMTVNQSSPVLWEWPPLTSFQAETWQITDGWMWVACQMLSWTHHPFPLFIGQSWSVYILSEIVPILKKVRGKIKAGTKIPPLTHCLSAPLLFLFGTQFLKCASPHNENETAVL